MSEKLLAEWFWIDRWMGSSAFTLPAEAKGVYREMLSQAWRRGAKLPNDHDAIRRCTGVSEKEWARTWPKIKQYWREEGEHLINDTQVEVYREALAQKTQLKQRAQAAAQARWGALPKHADEQCSSIAGSSAGSSARAIPSDLRSPEVQDPDRDLSAEQGDRARAVIPRAAGRTDGVMAGALPKNHRNCAECSPDFAVCVPAAVHQKLRGLLSRRFSGDQAKTDTELRAWYARVWQELPADVVMGDAFKFWQARFDAAFASPVEAKLPMAKAVMRLRCDHTPACQDDAEHTRKLAQARRSVVAAPAGDPSSAEGAER